MGHAMYIGRVGALAVALGVGVAAATGFGIGSPAVAWAEDGTQSSDNAPDTANDSADAPSNDPSSPADTVINTAVPQTTPDSAPAQGPTTGTGPTVPEMNFSNTGGAHLSGLDEDSDLDEDADPGEDAEQGATTPTPIVHTPQTPVTQAETPPPAAAIDTAVVTPEPPTDDLLPPADTNGRTLIGDPTGPTDQGSDADAGQFSVGQPSARTMSTLTVEDPAAPQMFTTAGPLTPAPTPLTAQPANLIDALSGAPAALANIAITAINTLLTSIFSPGPATPAPPMMLFIVLGWVQRELQRSFFNKSPTAVVDTITTSEDTGVNIAVLANDIDADVSAPVAGLPGGDVLTVTDYTQPAHGSVVLNEDSTFTYTPNANYTGTDSFSYTVSDEASPWHVHGLDGLSFGGGHTSTTNATITITPVDDTPTAIDDGPISVAEDSGPTLIQVLANDTDADAGPIKVQSVTDPAGGSVTFTDTTVTYTPDANFNGTDTFTYTLNGESTATVTVTVTAVDDNPVANPDFPTTDEDSAFIFDALYNDTDIDAGPKEITAVTQPTNGTAAVIGEGAAIIYTPDADFNGTDTFTYTLNGGSTATVTFTVIAVDDNPVAVNDTATITEDSPTATIDVLANDTDPDAGPKQITAVTQPTAGTVTFTDTTLTYTPNPDAFTTTAPDTFTYTLNGGSTATVAVTITAVNEAAPVIEQVTSTPGVGNTWVVSVTASDIDGDAISTTVTAADATIPVTVTQLPGGGFQVVADPTWAAANPGALVPVTVTVTDTHGTSSTDTRDIGTANNVTAVGLNNAGQLNIPALPAGVTYTEVGAGRLHTVLLRSDGTAVAVGFNYYGQTNIPPLPEGVTYTKVFDSDGGADHTVLLRSDGTAVTLGGPAIPELPDGVTYTQVAASVTHTVLLRSDGTAVTVGGPAIPELPTGVEYTQVAAGGSGNAGYHTVLLRSDGTAVGVGSNSSGQINIPALPTGVKYTQVAAGVFGNTVLLRSDGTAVGIGQTFGGLLNLPAPPAGVAYTQVDVAINYTVLLRSDGTVIGVGGDFSDSGGENIPALPTGVTYTQVAAGVGHTVLMSSTTAIPVNDPPVAVDDAATVAEGATTTIALTTNDTDVDGGINPATVVITGQPTAGSVTVNPNGTVSYASNGTEVTSDSFTYRVNDVDGATSNEAIVTITVTAVDDAPVAAADAATVAEDSIGTVIQVLANDTDIDAGLKTVVEVTDPANGTTVPAADGSSITYTPDANFSGTDTFSYTLNGGSTATVTVTVIAADSPPVAANDIATVAQNRVTTLNVLANDTDVDGGAKQVQSVTDPAHGTAVITAGGTGVTYTPDADFNGTDTFTYTLNGASTATVTVTVIQATVSDTINLAGESPAGMVLSLDGTRLYVAQRSPSSVAVIDTETNTVIQNIPVNGGSFGMALSPDGRRLAVSGSGTVTIINTETNTVTGTTLFSGDALGVTFVDTANGQRVYVTGTSDVKVINPYTNTVVQTIPVGVGPRAMAASADGRRVYVGLLGNQSSPGQVAVIDTTTNTVVDTDDDPTNGTTNITVGASPISIAVSGDRVYVLNLNSHSVSVIDAATNALVDTDNDPTNGITSIPLGGFSTRVALAVSPDGSLLYVAEQNAAQVQVFDIARSAAVLSLIAGSPSVSSVGILAHPDGQRVYVAGGRVGAPGKVTEVTVAATANNPPVAVNNDYSTSEDSALVITGPGVLGNDTDAENNPLTAVKVSNPAHGTVTFNPTGSFTYSPTANYNGPDSFTYKVNDGALDSNVATVNITVNPVNDAPAATNDSYSTNEDTALLVTGSGVLGNDTDAENNPLTAVKVTDPAHGTVTLNANGSFTYTPTANYDGPDSFTYKVNDGALDSNVATVNITVNAANVAPTAANDAYTAIEDTTLVIAGAGVLANDTDPNGNPLTAVKVTDPAHGTVTFNPNGSFTYSPTANYNGPDSFTYKVNDGTLDSDTATVTITVNAVNDAPAATDDAYSTNEDTPLVITGAGVLGNDTDVEGNLLTAVKVADPLHGTVTLNPNGSFTYTPAANYSGSDSFTYTANDGTLNSNVTTVNVTVNAVNDAPVGTSDAYTLAEDTTLTISAPGLLANDFDADGPLVISNRTSVSHGTIEVLSNGAFTYTPTANYNGTDSFTYRVSDGTVTSAPITVNFTITPVDDPDNAPPVGNTDAYTTAEDTTLTIPAPGLLTNDTDANGQQLLITDAIAPTHGTLAINPDGSFTYTPSLNYNGPDSFSYQVSDGIDKSASTTVNITVTPVNDAPVINNDTIPFPKNGFIGFSLQNRSSDVDNDTLTATLISGTTHGELFFDGVQRVFTYKPNTDYVGEDSFTYKVNDGTVDSPIATVTLNVS